MSDLVEFLLDRIREDENYARNLLRDLQDGDPPVAQSWSETSSGILDVGCDQFPLGDARLSRYIARHDPARVLADVAAKRLQIDMTFRYEATIDGEWGCCHEADSIARGECPATPVDGIRMLRLLALPYAEHPGYRSEWSPDE